jgi:FkbM family methyltransferase
MIVDAPLKFPATTPYYILGENETCRKLGRILARLRPQAEFRGFTDGPRTDPEAKLVVCDMSDPLSRQLLACRDSDDVILFPLPLQDAWSYWDYADIVLAATPPEAPYVPSQAMMLELFEQHGELAFVDGDRSRLAFRQPGHLYYQQENIAPYRDLIDTVRDGLSDEASKVLYDQIISGSPVERMMYYARQAFLTVQYFEIVNYGICRTVVNGGVFEGFELPFLSLKLPQGATVHNVDPLGHDFLSDYSHAWVDASSIDWREHRLALARSKGELELGDIGNAQLSRAAVPPDPDRRHIAQAISIDALVAEEEIAKVDLIKLDLEGGDAEALAGAVDTIVGHRPQIAASIYHYVNDFWRIPELLMRICEDYEFYLGAYSRERWETVLYAIPREVERPAPAQIAA